HHLDATREAYVAINISGLQIATATPHSLSVQNQSICTEELERMLWQRPPAISNSTTTQFLPSGFSAGQVMILFAALTLLISIPIGTHPLPPLSDYVNHLARIHV